MSRSIAALGYLLHIVSAKNVINIITFSLLFRREMSWNFGFVKTKNMKTFELEL